MSRVFAIANQKGGVGKTTTSINLGASLAILEKKILLIDADPQANCTSGLGFELKSIEKSIYDALTDDVEPKDIILQTGTDGLDIVPSHIDLVGAEIELLNVESREYRLKSFINKVRDMYDYIIIDCSPSLGLLTVNALTAADAVIIPVQCEYFALEGLGKLLNTVKMIQARLNPDLQTEGFLLTMYDSRLRLSNQVVDQVRQHFQEMVFKTLILRNIRLSEAPSYGKPVIEYDATSSGAVNYLNLAKEILEKDAARNAAKQA
ncbi:MAG: ParA family protein [Bacteroidales bacterium]|nr:ParA family protein [Bacteroidales bacterium]MBQ5574917.1 ParA family protein [Bacteroidales bacterium]MBR3713862.1 ParA family protein [Bacteroidales bacterium]